MTKVRTQKWSSDLTKLLESLSKESNYFWIEYCQKKNDVWRRAYVRSVFAEMEAVIYCLKQSIKAVQKSDHLPLTIDEQKKLDEYYYQKGQGRKKVKISYFLPFAKNVSFTLDLFALANYVFDTINKNSSDWQNLIIASMIRNRIIHPKRPKEIVITDEEMKIIRVTELWFMNTVIEIMRKSVISLRGQIKGMSRSYTRPKCT